MPQYLRTGRGRGPPIYRPRYFTIWFPEMQALFPRKRNGKQPAGTAGVEEDDGLILLKFPSTELLQEQGESLPCIDRVEENALLPRHELHGLLLFLSGDTVACAHIVK